MWHWAFLCPLPTAPPPAPQLTPRPVWPGSPEKSPHLGGCGASTPVQNVCAVVNDERLLQTRQTVDSACVDMHIWMGNVAGNKGFTVWAESVQGTRFKKAGASQSLHYRREKTLKNVKCLELLRAVRKAGRRARAGPSFQWRAGLSHQTSRSTATWTGLLKFNDKTCRDHSEEHTWELFKIVLYNIRVLFLTLEKAELGGVWLGAGAAGWGLRRPLCCPGRTACSGPFQKEKPPSTANSQDDNRNAFFGLYYINSFGNSWISTTPQKSS